MHACAWLVVIFPHPPSLVSEAARAKMGHAGTTLRQGHEDHSEHWLRGGVSSLAWDFPTRGSTRGGVGRYACSETGDTRRRRENEDLTTPHGYNQEPEHEQDPGAAA